MMQAQTLVNVVVVGMYVLIALALSWGVYDLTVGAKKRKRQRREALVADIHRLERLAADPATSSAETRERLQRYRNILESTYS